MNIEIVALTIIATLFLVAFIGQRRLRAHQMESIIEQKTSALESEHARHQKADEELKRKQRILAQAEKIAHFGSWEWDISTNKLTWSEELFRIYDLPQQDFENATEAMLSRIHPDDRERIRGLIFNAFKTCTPVEYFARIIRPDGTLRVLHVKGEIIIENGRPVRMYGACQDVTELKEAERSLARLGTIIASSDDAIIGQTPYGTIISWNKGAERIFGYTAAEILEQSILVLIPRERVDEREKVLAGIKHGDQIEHFETERRCKDGRIIHVSLSTYPVRNDDGSISGASTILRDITEQKRAENLIRSQTAELEQANQRLLDLDKLKSEFVSNVSHELRTPIAAVKGAAANMQYGFLGDVTEDQKEALDIIKRNVDRLSRLIENLLDLSRIESGAFRLDRKRMDLRVPVKWAINGILALAKEKQLAIKLDLPESPAESQVDEDRIVQVVTNLVGNALRFARKEIRVALFADEKNTFLIVEDDGPGVPTDELSKIFERFHQARTNTGQGTGLGLSIVSAIVGAHGGRIWAENRPAHDGTGARFTVILPMSEQETFPAEGPQIDALLAAK